MTENETASDPVTRFWERPLDTLSQTEWEALCDGCGRCCLKKLFDGDSDRIQYTRVACRNFDRSTHQCRSYQQRFEHVADCIDIRVIESSNMHWLPDTCAYRLRMQDLPLPHWHPLRHGGRDAMIAAGIPVGERVLSEEYVHPESYEEHVIRWVST